MDLHLKYPATPANAAKIAGLMIEPAQRISKVDLDYSVASLRDVDRIARKLWREVGPSGRVTETVFGFGCYVGEVFVRHSGARWRATDETPLKEIVESPMVLELAGDHFCDPIGQVLKRFRGSRASLQHFYAIQTGVGDRASHRVIDHFRRLLDQG